MKKKVEPAIPPLTTFQELLDKAEIIRIYSAFDYDEWARRGQVHEICISYKYGNSQNALIIHVKIIYFNAGIVWRPDGDGFLLVEGRVTAFEKLGNENNLPNKIANPYIISSITFGL